MKKTLCGLALIAASACYGADNGAADSFQEGFQVLQAEMHQKLQEAEIVVNKSKDISKKLKMKARSELEKVKALESEVEKVAATPDVSEKLKCKLLKQFNKLKNKKKHRKENDAEKAARSADGEDSQD